MVRAAPAKGGKFTCGVFTWVWGWFVEVLGVKRVASVGIGRLPSVRGFGSRKTRCRGQRDVDLSQDERGEDLRVI